MDPNLEGGGQESLKQCQHQMAMQNCRSSSYTQIPKAAAISTIHKKMVGQGSPSILPEVLQRMVSCILVYQDPRGIQRGRMTIDERLAFPGISSASLGRSDGPELRTRRSYMPQGGGAGFSNLSGPLASRSTSIKLDGHREGAKHPHWPEHRSGSRYDQFDIANASATHHLLDRPSPSHKKDGRIVAKDSTAGGNGSKNRIHYSGPLMPPGGNLDEMLKEHERQIQQAVRKARLEKDKNKSNGARSLSEALLFPGRNSRSDA